MCVSESRNKWLFGTKMLIAALKPTICQNSKKKETCWKRFDFSPRKELYKPPHQTHRIDRNQCRDIALGRFHIARKHPTKVERIYEQRQNGAEQRNRQHNLMLIFECQKELSSGRKGFEALFVGGWVVRFHGSVARATERKVHEKLFPLYSFSARYSFTLRYCVWFRSKVQTPTGLNEYEWDFYDIFTVGMVIFIVQFSEVLSAYRSARVTTGSQ